MNHQNQTFEKWIQAIETYRLPDWDALPELNLYMDQVITLMENHLTIYQKSEDKVITPSMINNYVKLEVIPKPIKKRYSRIHLAYLIMVCSLKQVLPISVIQRMLPLSMTEQEVMDRYMAFKKAQEHNFSMTAKRVYEDLKALQKKEETPLAEYIDYAVSMAMTGNIYKIISEFIINQVEAGRQ